MGQPVVATVAPRLAGEAPQPAENKSPITQTKYRGEERWTPARPPLLRRPRCSERLSRRFGSELWGQTGAHRSFAPTDLLRSRFESRRARNLSQTALEAMPELLSSTADRVDWERAQRTDPRDPRWLGEAPCGLQHEAEQKYRSNAHMIWSLCRVCSLRLMSAPMKDAPAAHHQTPLAEDVRTALKLARDRGMWDTLNGPAMRGLIKEVQGRAQANRAAAKASFQRAACHSAVAALCVVVGDLTLLHAFRVYNPCRG